MPAASPSTPQTPNAPPHRTRPRLTWLSALELALWALVVLGSLAFIAVKLRNWEPLDRMPQDDFAVYYLAANASAIDPSALYQTERWASLTGQNLRLGGPFPYAPTVALIFAPFVGMPYPQAGMIWVAVDVALTATIAGLLVGYGLRRQRRHGEGGWAFVLGAGLWLLLPATIDNIYLGNINLVMALLITLAYLWFDSRRRWVAALSGVAIGMAATIKPYPLGLALLAPWARRWWFALGIVLGLPLAVFLGRVQFGPAVYTAYADMLRQYYVNLSPPGASIVQNQSILATVQKLAYSGILPLSVHEQATGAITVAPLLDPAWARPLGLALALVVAAITLWALWRFPPHTWLGRTQAWTLLLAAMLMLAPVSWSIYVMLAPPLHPGIMTARRVSTPAWRLLFPLGYLFVLVQRGYPLWLSYLPWMVLTSTALAGVTLWWAALVRLAQRPTPAPCREDAPSGSSLSAEDAPCREDAPSGSSLPGAPVPEVQP